MSAKIAQDVIDAHRRKTRERILTEENTSLLHEIHNMQKRFQTIVDLDAEYKPKDIKATNKLNSQATAFLIASDWHFEETVDPKTVNGLNSYNLKIAEKRANNFFANGNRLLQIARQDIAIKNVVLGLLGDMITGYIHEELVEGNSLSPTEALLKVYDVLINGITYLLEETGCNITVICKYGNHGRTTQKSRIATAYKNSFEWLMYHMIAKHFSGEDRINFVIENSYHTDLMVYDYNIRMHHGDWTRYIGGVGGVTIPLNKAIAQWNKNKVAYLDVLGHYHSMMLDTGSSKFVINGSLIGYSPYAIFIKAAYEEAKQAFFLIDQKRGKTLSAPIFVE